MRMLTCEESMAMFIVITIKAWEVRPYFMKNQIFVPAKPLVESDFASFAFRFSSSNYGFAQRIRRLK